MPRKAARIEIIPMIDVMMFLLVFFVLISLNSLPSEGRKSGAALCGRRRTVGRSQARHPDAHGRRATVYLDGTKISLERPERSTAGCWSGPTSSRSSSPANRRRKAAAPGKRSGCIETCRNRFCVNHRQAAVMTPGRTGHRADGQRRHGAAAEAPVFSSFCSLTRPDSWRESYRATIQAPDRQA